ncbi:MAG: hypothetical protein Q9180_006699, partial [Flavoplaca navasiana]
SVVSSILDFLSHIYPYTLLFLNTSPYGLGPSIYPKTQLIVENIKSDTNMSFFKKMVDKFDDLMGSDDEKKKDEKKDDKKEDKKEDKHEGTKDLSSHAPAYGQDPQYSHQAPYSQQPQTQYGQYGAPPSHAPNTGGPPLAPGWIAQWDPNSLRYYYLEQATGRTKWDPPQAFHGSFAPPGAPSMGGHGYDAHGPPGAPGAAGGYYSQETKHIVQDTHDGGHKDIVEKKEKKEKKSGKGGMLAAGAGGLAAGAVGGAMIGHTMEPPPPELEPPPDDHSSVSSSDKEDLEEAREAYENASDASDREEAKEEYEEAYDEAYD